MREDLKAQLLGKMIMFSELSADELDRLWAICIHREYRKKTSIFTEGSNKEAVYFIQEGLVKTFKTDENGHEHIVSFLKAGDMFPHTGLFNRNPYPATAEAVVDTVVLAIPVKQFEQLIMDTPSIAIKVMGVMSEKLRELQQKLQDLTGQDVQDRGHSFLLKLAEHYGTTKNGEVHINVPMTHQEFASTIGTTRETVTRLLNQLRKDGIVEMDRHGFVVHDLEALRNWRHK